MLLKQPGFSLIAVLTLAIGIGATAAVFSLIQGVLLTPPPYKDPQRLVLAPAARIDSKELAHARGWAPVQWLEWQKETKSLEALAAYGWSFGFLVENGGSQSLEGMFVSKDYFRVTGLQPVIGRTFLDSEIGPNAAPAIIIGYDLWQRKFNRDPNILGKPLRLSNQPNLPRVVGVMPPGARFLPYPNAAKEPNYNVDALVDFWIPAAPRPNNKNPGWELIGRLRPGVTIGQAQSELALLAQREAAADRDFAGITPRLQFLSDEMNRDGRRILLPLLGAAALVLLIACGNAAALLLVRGLQRQQEYAVRTALGVSRGTLFRQVSMESILLALMGGALGAALAIAIVRIFRFSAGHAIPRLDAVTTGWPLVACGLGSALLAAILAGLFPAIRASRLDPVHVLKSAGPKSTAGRTESGLLRAVATLQTALTLALLIGAGLLIRTMVNLSNVQSGYNTAHIVTMTVTSVEGKWLDFHRRALERVAALPGVEGAAFAWGVPFTGNNWPFYMDIEGQPVATRQSDQISLPVRAVTTGYFKLIGQTVSRGRDIRPSDDAEAPKVAVVNQALADRYFAGGDPVGKKLWTNGLDKPSTEIVGLITNGRTSDLTKPAEPEVYVPLWQATAFSKDLVVRAAADPHPLIAAIQRELRQIEPAAAVENIRTLDQVRAESVASRSFAAQLLIGFAIVGTALTLVGIYGLLSLSVASRGRELAIRSAVGAGQRDIRNLVLVEGFRLTGAGIIIGVIASLLLARVLRSFLFEVNPADPVTLIAAALLFALIALLACLAPGRRAARVDIVEALRLE
jgi:putative ABC transport system permease protein